jgi:hypothetical protein
VNLPSLTDVLPALAEEVETGLRNADRNDLADAVNGLRIHRCTMADSSGAWLYLTTKTLTAREAQVLRGDKDMPADELKRQLAHGYSWPPDETIVLGHVRVCVWQGAIEQLCVTDPGMHRPALRALARRFGGA